MNSLLAGLLVTVAAAQTPAPSPAADQAVLNTDVAVGSRLSQSPELSAPFRNLFAKAAEEARRREQRAANERVEEAPAVAHPGIAGDRPKVVCGLVVMQANPDVDARMIRRPAESTTTMHIRKIAPPACAE